MSHSTTIYDSQDPNHPDLPHLDIIDDSSFEGYNFSEDDSSDFSSDSSISSSSDVDAHDNNNTSDNERPKATGKSHKKVSFFSGLDSSTSTMLHLTPGIKNSNLQQGQSTKKKQKSKARKYHDSQSSSSSARLRANWEPGVTPSTNVSLHSIGSAITITDYSDTRYRVEHLELPTLLEDMSIEETKKMAADVQKASDNLVKILKEKPSWSKVRWVNINGLSWEAISIVSQFFQLHRLSIEDMIDIPQRTKVDQYANYTMCILPLVKLIKLKKDFKNLKLSQRLEAEAEFDKDEDKTGQRTNKKKKKKHTTSSITEQISNREMRRVSDWSSEVTSRRKIRLLEIHRPLSHRNLSVGIEQVSLFIAKGTVISFFENSGSDIESAILTRLSNEETILRDSCDASILLQSIIDSVVDLMYPINTAYRRRLEEMQADILTDAKINNVSELYLMLDELSLLKKSISPITSLVYTLRDHSKRAMSGTSIEMMNKPATLRPTFISEVCDLYLSDVADHTQSFTEDIVIMESMVNNLTSMVFNMTAVQSNNSMSYLSLVSVIFLPLMFWSSYYGMNFDKFSDLKRDVGYYWKVSISFTAIFILIVCWNYFVRFIKSWLKVLNRWRREYVIYRELKKRKRQRHLKQELRKKRAAQTAPPKDIV